MASYAGDATQGIPTQIGREPEHLHEFFEAQVTARPDHIAIEALGKKMTYAELDRLANRIAHWLRARGIGPGSLVGLCQSKSCNLFASMLGILKAGAGYVPVDTRFPEERIRHVFADAGVGMVVTEQRLLATLGPDFCTRTLVVDTQADEIEQMPGSAIPREELAASSICYVIYTSGSTGRPKGVMISHRNAAAFVTSLPTVSADAAGPRLPGFLGRIRCLRRGDLGGVRDRRHAGGGAGAGGALATRCCRVHHRQPGHVLLDGSELPRADRS